MVILQGTLRVKKDVARRIAVYIVRGKDVLGYANVQDDGSVRINVAREVLRAPSPYGVEAVVGPAGLAQHFKHVDIPNLQRMPIDRVHFEKAEVHLALDKIQLNEELIKVWWPWCEWYCVSGTVVGPSGCPVPFAQVTVYSVVHTGTGYAKTPQATVTADANGQFNACFAWCRCFFCCWPCWPYWWWCWPWWWERDILHVIESIERVPPIPPGPPTQPIGEMLALNRPVPRDLMRGQGFISARKLEAEFTPNPARTALIRNKLSDPMIRAVFPWWWWCCDDPNVVFSVTQGPNTIVDENPATDTRWCLENDSTVTLIGNSDAISACPPGPKPAQGYVWTRVGNITVDHIHGGYADGTPGTDTSDLAFAGGLNIYGEFAAASNVAYYQVDAGQWSGDPSRGGSPPGSSSPMSAELWNHVFILRAATHTVDSHDVKMGPFDAGGLTNLYATQEQRSNAPAPWPAFPTLNPGDVVIWAYNGLKVSTSSANLINGANVGGVDLTISGYDNTFAPIALPGNPNDKLTLEIDNTVLQRPSARINSLSAFTAGGMPVTSTGTGDCPAYQVGPGGYVILNVTVNDPNGHLWEYLINPDFGHGNTGPTKMKDNTGTFNVASPPPRGYSQPPTAFPPGYGGPPNTAQKDFKGGTEDIKFVPTVNCCYDFRLDVGKRVTNGYDYPVLYTADFQTATINVT